MKQGKTVLHENERGLPPRVVVGTDDRMVWVEFGTFAVLLGNLDDVFALTARCVAWNADGDQVPVEARVSTDVRGAVEFRAADLAAEA